MNTHGRGSKDTGDDPVVSRRFLVVDRYVDLLEALQLVLEERDQEVKAVSSEGSALNALESFHPDVVLLDIQLFEAEGNRLVPRLREHPNARLAWIIGMSSGDEGSDRARIRGHGFDGLLRKPFDVDSLLELAESLARARLADEESHSS